MKDPTAQFLSRSAIPVALRCLGMKEDKEISFMTREIMREVFRYTHHLNLPRRDLHSAGVRAHRSQILESLPDSCSCYSVPYDQT